MSNPEFGHGSTDSAEDLSRSSIGYHCVCGEILPANNLDGLICSKCGRRYAAEVVLGSTAETISLPSLSQADLIGTPENRLDQRLAEGDCLGHFRIIRMLGHGGMGTVYQALDESLQRYVAVKVIGSAQRPQDDNRLDRLLQEARAQARVNHPNVVHIYFVGHEGKTPFLAMELVHGPTVADRLRNGPLPFTDVVQIGLQVADALRQAARYDIIHGDIKPSNLLMAGGGVVKLSDFGLARRMSDAAEPTGIAGTPIYLPPEALEGRSLDARGDIYSLGVTLFEMTFGRIPLSFTGSSLPERLLFYRTAPIEFPEVWPSDIPEFWRSVLERMLAKNQDDRYSGYDELIRDLRRARPVSLPRAALLARGTAWLVDFLLASSAILFLEKLFEVLEPRFPQYRALLLVLNGIAYVSVPMLASLAQAFWGSSPGKMLLQQRIVDQHGLTPSRPALALRMAAQFIPVWGLSLAGLFEKNGFVAAGNVILTGSLLVFLFDMLVAFVRRDRLCLHDVLLRTNVVLDTETRDKS